MPLNVLAVGDCHFVDKELENLKTYSTRLISIANELKPDIIVLLGDILHWHNKAECESFNLACKMIEELSKISKTYVIIGNHDMINHMQFLSSNHFFNPLKKWKNVTIVDDVIIETIKGYKFTFCPYVPDGRFIEALNTKAGEWEDSSAIFCHQTFLGCEINGRISKKGDDPHSVPVVYSGHIHKSQVIGNVHYVGSSRQCDYTDITKKYVWLVRISDSRHSVKRVSMTLRPKKYLRCTVDEMSNIDQTLTKDNDVKIQLVGDPVDFSSFRKTELYREMLSKDFQFTYSSCVDKYHDPSDSHEKVVKYQTVLEQLVNQKSTYVKKMYEDLLVNN